MAPFRLLWRPRSRAQYDTVERLAVRHRGVLVRELPDGSAEVLAERRGVVNRHKGGDRRLLDGRRIASKELALARW
jgi:molybdate-binding protein